MKTPPACTKCDATAAHYEVTACVECDTLTCCDCKDAIAHELETCGNEACALKAIARLRATVDRLFTRSLARERATLPARKVA